VFLSDTAAEIDYIRISQKKLGCKHICSSLIIKWKLTDLPMGCC